MPSAHQPVKAIDKNGKKLGDAASFSKKSVAGFQMAK